MLETLTHEMFEPHLDEIFTLTLPDSETIELKLVEVEELPVGRRRRNAPALKRKPFSLIFTAAPRLQQSMYPINHAMFGSPQMIFIVPIAEIDGGYEYEAVFT